MLIITHIKWISQMMEKSSTVTHAGVRWVGGIMDESVPELLIINRAVDKPTINNLPPPHKYKCSVLGIT